MGVRDTNNVPKLLRVLEALEKWRIEIGIFGEDDSTILMIATVNEFGVDITVTDKMRGYLASQGLFLKKETATITIPERSFLRGYFDSKKNDIGDKMVKLLEKVIKLELPVETFFEVTGQYIVGGVQQYLTDLKEPPKHPYTLSQGERKNNPLINTGRLRDSITFKIRK